MNFVRSLRSSLFVLSCLSAAASLGGTATAQVQVEKAWKILDAATSDSNTEKRMNSISTLGLITHNPHTQQIALHALENDEKPEVRASAANALGDMGATATIPQLTKAVKTDKDAGVVLAAAHSLLMLKQQSAYEV
jgi:HEAT repeat protein